MQEFLKLKKEEPKKNGLKYIVFTYSGDGCSVAKHLMDEGSDVVVAQFQDKKEYLSDEALKKYEEEEKERDEEDIAEHKEAERRRLSLYDGLLEKHPEKEILKWMKEIPDKDN